MKSIKIIAAVAVLAASSSANAWWEENNGFANAAYEPSPAMNEEEMNARLAAIEKAQQEAFERHQEAMKQLEAEMAQQAPEFLPAVAEFPAFGEIPAVEAPTFERAEKPDWVKEIEAKRAERMNNIPAFGEAPNFDVETFEKPEKPEWVKEIEAQRAERMKDVPEFDIPEFKETTYEQPAWVKEVEAERAELKREMPTAEEMNAVIFELPTEEEMAAAHETFIKESDERRAERDKAYQERVAASKKRHQEFVNKYINKDETPSEAPAEEVKTEEAADAQQS